MVAELCTRAMQARTGRLMLTGRLFRELWATIKSVPNSQVRRLRFVRARCATRGVRSVCGRGPSIGNNWADRFWSCSRDCWPVWPRLCSSGATSCAKRSSSNLTTLRFLTASALRSSDTPHTHTQDVPSADEERLLVLRISGGHCFSCTRARFSGRLMSVRAVTPSFSQTRARRSAPNDRVRHGTRRTFPS